MYFKDEGAKIRAAMLVFFLSVMLYGLRRVHICMRHMLVISILMQTKQRTLFSIRKRDKIDLPLLNTDHFAFYSQFGGREVRQDGQLYT